MHGARGFTLVELIVTVGVAAILIGLGVPSFVNTVRDARMTSGVNELVTSIQLGRSEAVKRRVPVTLCRSADTRADPPACGGGGGWETGWIVFVDGNDADADGDPDANGTIDAGEEIVRRSAGFPPDSVTVQVSANTGPLGERLTIMPSGFPMTNVAAERNLLFCDARHNDAVARVLNISQTGRPQVRRAADVANLGMSCES